MIGDRCLAQQSNFPTLPSPPVREQQRLALTFQGGPIYYHEAKRTFAYEDLQLGRQIALPLYAEVALRCLVDPATGSLDLSRTREVLI